MEYLKEYEIFKLFDVIKSSKSYKVKEGGYKDCHMCDEIDYVILIEKDANPKYYTAVNNRRHLDAIVAGLDTPKNIGRLWMESGDGKTLITAQQKAKGISLKELCKNNTRKEALQILADKPQNHYDKLILNYKIIRNFGGDRDVFSGQHIYINSKGFTLIDVFDHMCDRVPKKIFNDFLPQLVFFAFFNKYDLGDNIGSDIQIASKLGDKLLLALNNNKVQCNIDNMENFIIGINRQEETPLKEMFDIVEEIEKQRKLQKKPFKIVDM